MAGGTPTKYKPEYIEKVDEYLQQCKDGYVKVQLNDTEAKDKWKVNLPTIEGFAKYINVPRRSVYEWRDKHEQFSHTLDKILAEQKERLLNMGLSGDYVPMIAKMILSANHGMNEKTESESTVKVDDQSFTQEEKESLLSLLNDKGST